MNKLGMDVSDWQPVIDWEKAKTSGIEFAFIKATQGADIACNYFKAHWQNSKAAGIPRGAYHFYDYRVNPISQAEWLLKNCPGPGEYGYVLDAEKLKSKLTIKVPARYMDDLRVFCEFIEKETDTLPILYTGFYWWKDNGGENATWARRNPLWIAGYNWTAPMCPLPWGPDGWTIWQFTNKGVGALYGIGPESKQVDLDTWRRPCPVNQ